MPTGSQYATSGLNFTTSKPSSCSRVMQQSKTEDTTRRTRESDSRRAHSKDYIHNQQKASNVARRASHRQVGHSWNSTKMDHWTKILSGWPALWRGDSSYEGHATPLERGLPTAASNPQRRCEENTERNKQDADVTLLLSTASRSFVRLGCTSSWERTKPKHFCAAIS